MGDNGAYLTPVAMTDTSTASSLLILCFVHVVSSLTLVIYHDCHIHIRYIIQSRSGNGGIYVSHTIALASR